MKLTVENAIEIAKKYNFHFDEDLLGIIIPTNIYIDDGDFSFCDLKLVLMVLNLIVLMNLV